MCKSIGYCLSACANRLGTVCPPVQIDGVLFVRVCKNDGVLLVWGTICPEPTSPHTTVILFVGPLFEGVSLLLNRAGGM